MLLSLKRFRHFTCLHVRFLGVGLKQDPHTVMGLWVGKRREALLYSLVCFSRCWNVVGDIDSMDMFPGRLDGAVNSTA